MSDKATISRQFKIVIVAEDIILTRGGSPAASTVGALQFQTSVEASYLGNEVEVVKAMKVAWDELCKNPNFPKLWEKPKY